ncbi:hypothetical protein [Loktanella salsilacus]|uniref:hypothetical protein n=1 Tax=Loktanella salsilacus TaxID=195913 RepID=UPI003703903A
MIPGSIGDAVGMLFCLAAFSCWALAIRFSVRGLIEVVTGIKSGNYIDDRDTDSGTCAVLFAGGFVLFMLFRVAVA